MAKKKPMGVFDGTVATNPYIYTSGKGLRMGRMSVSVEIDGSIVNANMFTDDPEDKQLFSFKADDPVEVEITQNGQYYNAAFSGYQTGSANAAKALEAALDQEEREQNPGEDDEPLTDLMNLYTKCRRIAMGDQEFMNSISAERGSYAYEETVRGAATSLFIEANRRNIR